VPIPRVTTGMCWRWPPTQYGEHLRQSRTTPRRPVRPRDPGRGPAVAFGDRGVGATVLRAVGDGQASTLRLDLDLQRSCGHRPAVRANWSGEPRPPRPVRSSTPRAARQRVARRSPRMLATAVGAESGAGSGMASRFIRVGSSTPRCRFAGAAADGSSGASSPARTKGGVRRSTYWGRPGRVG